MSQSYEKVPETNKHFGNFLRKILWFAENVVTLQEVFDNHYLILLQI